MDTTNYSDARKNLTELMNKTHEDHSPVLITRKSGTACVLMSLEEYESLEETAYLLRSPENARHLMTSIAELKSGKCAKRDLVE